jgi:hypothetical protein
LGESSARASTLTPTLILMLSLLERIERATSCMRTLGGGGGEMRPGDKRKLPRAEGGKAKGERVTNQPLCGDLEGVLLDEQELNSHNQCSIH